MQMPKVLKTLLEKMSQTVKLSKRKQRSTFRKGHTKSDNNNGIADETCSSEPTNNSAPSIQNNIIEQIRVNEKKSQRIILIANIIVPIFVGCLTAGVAIIAVNIQNKANYDTTKLLITQEHKPRLVFSNCFDCIDMHDYLNAYNNYDISEKLMIDFNIYTGVVDNQNVYYLYYARKPNQNTIYSKVNFEMILLCNAGEGSIFKLNVIIEPVC
ncbi:MAG: hypothetical protein LLF96_10215, partial [Eubacteriales bacterium]|nr:hypothetical protein [Eubacteriales bacterium]